MNIFIIDLLITALTYLVNFMYTVIIVRVIISWIPMPRNNLLHRIIYTLTEPILQPIRKIIYNSPLGGEGLFIDFSPCIAILLMQFLKFILIRIILNLAM